MFPQMAAIVPPGKAGDAEVQHITITDRGGIHAITHGYATSNGTYALMRVRGAVVMSDTDDERRSNHEAAWQARGRVLVGGLGLGMVVCAMLRKPEVDHITVVELNPNVVALVEPAVRGWANTNELSPSSRLDVVLGDVFTWCPQAGQQFDAIYFDIWNDICEDNLPEIARLHNRAKAWKARGGWMGSWQADILRDRRRRGY